MTPLRFLLSVLVFMFAGLIIASLGGASMYEVLESERERHNARRARPA